MSEDLHVALLNCVLEVVVHVSSGQDPSRAFPWATQQAGRGRSTLSLWDAIRWAQGPFARRAWIGHQASVVPGLCLGAAPGWLSHHVPWPALEARP